MAQWLMNPTRNHEVFLMVSFTVQKLLSLVKSHWFNGVFIVFILGSGSKKMLLGFMSKSILPLFSYNFIVSDFIFRPLIH